MIYSWEEKSRLRKGLWMSNREKEKYFVSQRLLIFIRNYVIAVPFNYCVPHTSLAIARSLSVCDILFAAETISFKYNHFVRYFWCNSFLNNQNLFYLYPYLYNIADNTALLRHVVVTRYTVNYLNHCFYCKQMFVCKGCNDRLNIFTVYMKLSLS